jgi:hypothetical protein
MRKDSILQNYYYSKLPKADEGLEYKGSSIVDYLATKGYSGKKAFRKELADQYGIENYDFSGSKNLELLSKIKENEEILKKIQPSFAPVSVERMVQMEKEASLPKETKPRTSKNLPNKRAVDLNALDARLNLAMMSFNPNTSAAITPLQSRMKWTPKPSTARETPKEVVQQPKGMAPAALEMMLQLPKTKFTQPQLMPGNVFQGMNMSIPSTQQSAQGVDNGFRAPYNPSSENKQLYPLFPQFGNTSGSTNNAPASSYSDVNYFDILKQDYENVKDAGKKIYNFGKEKAGDLYEFGKDKFEDLNDLKQQGLNFLERLYYKQVGDPVQISTLPESKTKVSEKPKIDSTKTVQEPVIPDFIDKPFIEGSPAWDDKEVYHATNIVDLNKVKLGIRNRGDRKAVKSSGWLFGAVDDENNFKHVQNALTDKLDPNQFYGGIDSKGKFELKKGKDFQNKDYKVLPFRVITNTEGLSRNKKGNYKTIDASKAAVGHISPVFEGNEGVGSAGLLINPNKKGAYDSYSKIDGGHIIVTTPDFKQKILLSGSVNEIDKQIKNFKKHYNIQKVNIVVPDNGAFSRTYMKKDGQMTSEDWEKLDNRNEAGGLGFYLEGQGYKNGGLVKAQDGLPFEGAIFNALHKKGDYPKERQSVINQLANLPIYSPDVRYASYQEALPIWRTNVENVPIEVNPNSPAGGSSYYGYGIPAFNTRFPYQGTVQLDPRDSDLINTGQRVTEHELRHAAFDGRSFIPQWYGDALYNTARKPEGFEAGAHQDRLNERASMALGARQAIIDKFGLKSNAKIPKELFNRYNREILETSLRQGRPIEQFSDLDETLRGARNATDAYNIINFELPRRKKGGMIEDNAGQWAHPGKNTRIRSPHITMEGVPYPVLAKANNGMSTMMQPGQNYYFPGADYVDEFPKKKSKGGWLEKYS